MNEENSNVGSNAGNPANADATTMVTEKISLYSGKVDGFIERVLGVIGSHPWDAWLDVVNRYITRFMPAAIAITGALAFTMVLFTLIKADMPISSVGRAFFILIPVAFSMHLAPKALALTHSLIANSEAEVIRPELMHILKVLLGLGGLLLGAFWLLNFNSRLIVPAIIAIVLAVLMIICLERPGIVGIKAGYPINCVEEVIALVKFPVRVIVALITPLTGIIVVGGIVYGVVRCVQGAEYDYGMSAALTFAATALIPFLFPLIVYLGYLVFVFTLDLYKALVSIPRKLDELKTK